MTDGEIKVITPDSLLNETMKLHEEGWRLVQICARALKDGEGNEITYSFGDELILGNLRLTVKPDEPLSSISHIYPTAYFYENEMHDLFGIDVQMMTVDFGGHFYKIGAETPFKK
ncbi:MAG: NADH-quinone oxidoreductase subunit C [Lachnospiraceae bacterium]|nr:NADH-quinone oxidoreductase subunit C [Lachnospiraceae bacterium]